VGLSIFLVLLAASLFTLRRVFRKRRLGGRAESPPPSPLMASRGLGAMYFPGGDELSRASTPTSYAEARAPRIAGMMGGRTKTGGVVLPKDF
jgi:hypothetical protein